VVNAVEFWENETYMYTKVMYYKLVSFIKQCLASFEKDKQRVEQWAILSGCVSVRHVLGNLANH
jgi:hypothetical protein